MTRYDGTLCPCLRCNPPAPPLCDQCHKAESCTEWHGLFVCDECLRTAQKDEEESTHA